MLVSTLCRRRRRCRCRRRCRRRRHDRVLLNNILTFKFCLGGVLGLNHSERTG